MYFLCRYFIQYNLSPALRVESYSALAAQDSSSHPHSTCKSRSRLTRPQVATLGRNSQRVPVSKLIPSHPPITLASQSSSHRCKSWTHGFHGHTVEDHHYDANNKQWFICDVQPCPNRYENALASRLAPYDRPKEQNEQRIVARIANPPADPPRDPERPPLREAARRAISRPGSRHTTSPPSSPSIPAGILLAAERLERRASLPRPAPPQPEPQPDYRSTSLRDLEP